jgi:hypothetical protein
LITAVHSRAALRISTASQGWRTVLTHHMVEDGPHTDYRGLTAPGSGDRFMVRQGAGGWWFYC